MANKKGVPRGTKSGSSDGATLLAAGKPRPLTVRPDPPDIRDKYYEAPLIQLRQSIAPPKNLKILDQGKEGACTGFGLAAAINLLLARSGRTTVTASARMLYEMAKLHDEWPGQDYDGSSLRGAVRGWHSMGVCTEQSWRYEPDGRVEELSIERAKEARSITLGAYFRLRPHLPDYHSAICQAEVLFVSANVHSGWTKPDADGAIKYQSGMPIDGGHAFAVVGYNEKGFWLQNSWGDAWGTKGLALWTYEDWLENVVDAWAVRLALPVPQVFGRTAQVRSRQAAERPELFQEKIKRGEIAGHFVHVDDGLFKTKGELWSNETDVRQTANLVASQPDYDHLLIYAHGGLNSPEAAAKRIRAFKQPFMRNKIYPYSIMYDTGIVEELKDLLLNARRKAKGRAGGFRDFIDSLIEDGVRKPVTPLWEEMKRDARLPFEAGNDGTKAIQSFIDAFEKTPDMQIHLAGHSTGAVLLGHLLTALDRETNGEAKISSCTLMAPACTIEFYKEHFAPRLGKKTIPGIVKLPRLRIYNLTNGAEEDDHVAKIYGKSLLYLVSRALEREQDKPLLGLARDCARYKLQNHDGLEIIYAGKGSDESASDSHGGFDNDVPTMNGLLKLILKGKPDKPFEPKDMENY